MAFGLGTPNMARKKFLNHWITTLLFRPMDHSLGISVRVPNFGKCWNQCKSTKLWEMLVEPVIFKSSSKKSLSFSKVFEKSRDRETVD